MRAILIIFMVLFTINSIAWDKVIWDRENDPYRLGLDYMTRTYRYINKFSSLELSGSLDQRPWSGDYWPTYKGGIAYRWNDSGYDDETRFSYQLYTKAQLRKLTQQQLASLSPAEKYDLLLGEYQYPLVNHELQRTQVLRTDPEHPSFDFDFDIPTWEGLCHGWAPATLLFANPAPVKLENPDGIQIPFGASDIKALLTFFMHYSESRSWFLGKRCNVDFNELRQRFDDGEISYEELRRSLDRAECLDVNAGSFHIALANQISRLNEGFIVDITRDFEVWNQPVFAYDAHIVKELNPREDQRAFGTDKVIRIYLELHYVIERAQHWDYRENARDFSSKHYQYDLELNKKGEIIGGEWISEDRPDFLWKQDRAEFKGYFQDLERLLLF
ncbi:hypothetical protein [Bacteriovorax sp. DB6_IX]|uniref:hypothetical protein n=1 Tax=Bacteriovorax sp. DB6_IX TaxID=1353530 RepID=UPI00038A2330|nr:hypothetical protein [Bacteriovorax sp. DB6_IX]EQC50486.1 hypothetical protein M901_2352 [Bacteriovorax sp. DB6_IX]